MDVQVKGAKSTGWLNGVGRGKVEHKERKGYIHTLWLGSAVVPLLCLSLGTFF